VALASVLGIELWAIDRAELIDTLTSDGDAPVCLVFNRDGSRLFSGDAAGNITVWNLETREPILTVPAHETQWCDISLKSVGVLAIDLSPDGKTLATRGGDGNVKLWETTRLSQQVVDRRAIVAEATRLVDDRTQRLISKNHIVASLASDTSMDKRVQKAAIDIAYARLHRPLPTTDVQAAIQEIIEALADDPEQASQRLVHLVEVESGVAIDEKRSEFLTEPMSLRWYETANRLSRIDAEGFVELLTSLEEQHPHAAHFSSIRWRRYVRQQQYLAASEACERCYMLGFDPSQRFLWNAALLALSGDRDAYRDYCEQLIAEHGETKSFQEAERLIKACLLLPGVIDPERLPIPFVEETLEQGSVLNSWGACAFGTLALVALRTGNVEAAKACLERADAAVPAHLDRSCVLLIEPVQAWLSHQRPELTGSNQWSDALQVAKEKLDRQGIRRHGDGSLVGDSLLPPSGIPRYHELICEILCRELEQSLSE
jgi:hypothetical protein